MIARLFAPTSVNFHVLGSATALVLASAFGVLPALAETVEIPEIKVNGGLRFDSQGAGTPNTLSGYGFAPLYQAENGSLFYVDGFASALYGGQMDNNEFEFGGSARLGYRFLNDSKNWIFGVNAGADATGFDDEYFYQVGVGLEALNQGFELRLNGYIPLGETTYEQDYAGYSRAYLKNNGLYFADVKQDWYTSYSGGDIELGIPLTRWDNGSLWAYAGYYYLDAALEQADSSSGVNGRVEARINDNVAVGATVSYDNIFDTRATGYVRLGLTGKSLAAQSAKSAVEVAEQQFLALRGLPSQRVRDVRVNNVRVNVGDRLAKKAFTNIPWVIRCVGTNNPGNFCGYTNIDPAIRAGYADYILVADGTNSNLGGAQLNITAGTNVLSGANAPIINTQFGLVNLKTVYGVGSGAAPSISNGILGIGSNTTIEGFNFVNASITNYSTSNVRIAGNSFLGSYDGKGAIQFDGVTNAVIENNTITNPTTSALPGSTVATQIGRGISVVNGDNIQIKGNTITGATAEGIFIENIGTSPNNLISNNVVSDMRASADSNLEAGIFLRNTKDGYIKIDGNTVKNNNLTAGVGFPTARGVNSTDGIELNICRGGVNLGSDAFTDGIGACSSNATLTADITNNTVSNLQGGADGIDTNLGDNGRLNVTVSGNTVTGVGDEGFTLDAFGANTQVTATITNNTLKTSGAKGAAPGEDGSTDGIAVTFQENVSPTGFTDFTASGVYNFTITGNTLEADTDNLAGTNEKPEKAEGIKFTIGEKLENGNINLTAVIDSNTITTRSGDGVEFAVLEKAKNAANFTSDITVSNNTINQTNDAKQAGAADTGSVKDLIRFTFAEDADATTYAKGVININNNTVSTATGNGSKGDAVQITNEKGSSPTTLKVNVSNQQQDQKVKIQKVNGQIVADTVTNLEIEDNVITNANITLSDLANSSVVTKIGRGISVINSDKVTIKDNTITGATAEGIYIENIGTGTNTVEGNTVSDMRVSADSNLEAGIFVRNNKDGAITITGNTVKDNNLTSGVGFPAARGTNSTDGIEVNVCRGGVNLGSDAFTDGVAGACTTNATLTAVITKNTVSNLQGGADGIDANIGDNGRLNITVGGSNAAKNTVTGVGDEGFTLDAFGANTQATAVITHNTLKTSGAKGTAPGEDGSTDGIAVTFQENVSNTDFTASGVYNFTIQNNDIEADTDNLAGTIKSAEKAEGIKFTIGELLQNGSIELTADIASNTIKTRIGDGIEFAVNEKASSGVKFAGDIVIDGNTITQTNDSPIGTDNKSPRDIIKATFGEDGTGSYVTAGFTITDNVLITAAGAGDGLDYESLSTSALNNFEFKVTGNNFTQAADDDLKIKIPVGTFKIVSPAGTTNFDTHHNSVNTNVDASVTGSPAQTSALTDFVN
jgi:parallel beta-helix repeat protein